VLETKDKTQIAQSYAIARFLVNKHGLAGKDPVEAAKIDAIADLYKDFIAEVASYLHRKPNADKEQLKKTLFEPALQRFFPMFEKILKESGSGFLISSGVSWADMFFAEGKLLAVNVSSHKFISIGIQSLKNVEPEALNGHPELVAHQERVHALPGIKEYVATRPHSEF
jgi:glutathione S-transferase